jgi:hypothetical protein
MECRWLAAPLRGWSRSCGRPVLHSRPPRPRAQARLQLRAADPAIVKTRGRTLAPDLTSYTSTLSAPTVAILLPSEEQNAFCAGKLGKLHRARGRVGRVQQSVDGVLRGGHPAG